LAALQVYGLAQVVAPVHPAPPHCPYCAILPPPVTGGDVGAVPPVPAVDVGVVPPLPEALSLDLMNVKAAWPYSVP
jgi:hypothetical protein